jgi:hypothetical protein
MVQPKLEPACDTGWSLVRLEPDPAGCFLALFRRANQHVEFVSDDQIMGDILMLRNLHVDGTMANQFGPGQLRALARFVKEALGVRERRIDGAIRTTGASPGRRPHPLVF